MAMRSQILRLSINRGYRNASSNIPERLAELRTIMKSQGIDGFIVPTTDPHLSEYTECYDRKKFISGFSGSAGTAFVTEKHAHLWTDGRYII
jgi:Xaa-Pro aminopeptidase